MNTTKQTEVLCAGVNKAPAATECWCGREVLLTCKCGARRCAEHTMICSMLSCKCKQMMCYECLNRHEDAVLSAEGEEV